MRIRHRIHAMIAALVLFAPPALDSARAGLAICLKGATDCPAPTDPAATTPDETDVVDPNGGDLPEDELAGENGFAADFPGGEDDSAA